MILNHEREPDELLPIRTLEYILGTLRKVVKQKQGKPAFIIQLTLYNGQKHPYPYARSVFDYFEHRELARKILLDAHRVIDLHDYPDDVLASHQQLNVRELFMKHADHPALPQWIEANAEITKKLAAHKYIERSLRYIANARYQRIEDLLNSLGKVSAIFKLNFLPTMGITLFYYLLAGLVAASALCILITPNMLFAALSLAITLVGLASIFFLQGAAFIAVVLIMIQASSLLLIILFSLMLLKLDNNPAFKPTQLRLTCCIAMQLSLGLAAFFFPSIQAWPQPSTVQQFPAENSVSALGLQLLGPYALPLELAGIMLLIAIVGAIYIARGRHTS